MGMKTGLRSRPKPLQFLKSLIQDALLLYWELLKAMVPVLILVRVAVEFGALDILAQLFTPFMEALGLPGATGLVFATGVLVNNYGAAAALVGVLPYTDMSVAQLTAVLSMVLVAHALPLEQAISRKAGLSFKFGVILRFCMAMVYGWILTTVYNWGDWLQEPASIAWLPGEGAGEETWSEWVFNSMISLAWLFGIILALVSFLKVLEALKITDLLARLLAPVLTVMGIGKDATAITMIGVLLGLSFGGGLIIKEARAGHLKPRDIVLSLCFMALCHSLIEDTLFMIALGGDVTGVLIGRIVFSVMVMILISRVVLNMSDETFRRWLYRPALTSQAPTT